MNRSAFLGMALAVTLACTGVGSAAPSLVYHTFDPGVIPSSATGDVTYQVKVSGAPSRVVLALNLPDGSTSSRALHDDGADGDRTRRDGVYTVRLAASEIVRLLRPDDVYRVEVGFVEVYDGTSIAVRGNVFADVLTTDIPPTSVVEVAWDAQRTDYVVNIAQAGFVRSGGFNIEPLVRRFYQLFPDNFDFLGIVVMPGYFQNRYHFGVKSEVRGIGVNPFDTARQYGSAGRLLGITMFPLPSLFDPAETAFQHELGHQWINFLPFAPLNYANPHWPLSDLASGIMGFAEEGYGQGLQFPCVVVPVAGGATLTQRYDAPVFTDLDLYLMGLLPADQVQPHVVFPRGTRSSDLFSLFGGGTWTGQLQTVTIEDIVRQAGPRLPDAANSPHAFRVATILVSDALLSSDVMSYYSYFASRASLTEETRYHSGFARGMAKPFYLSTRGLGSIDPTLSSVRGSAATLSPFGAITRDAIAERVTLLSGRPISGSDGASDLPPGAVLVYRTSEGRLGKLEVTACGYDLAIRFVTYDSTGGIHSSNDRLVIPGTYLADLDAGAIQTASADFQWAQRSETLRELELLNGAVFAVWAP